MREILFRGKQVNGNKWVEGSLVKQRCYDNDKRYKFICCITNEALGHSMFISSKTVIPSTVGQYTGLADKNGKKIFEGDILEFTNNDGEKTHYEIFWNEAKSAWYIREHHGFEDDCIEWNPKQFKIIGNIYDNPELMRKSTLNTSKSKPCPFCGEKMVLCSERYINIEGHNIVEQRYVHEDTDTECDLSYIKCKYEI